MYYHIVRSVIFYELIFLDYNTEIVFTEKRFF